MARFVQDPVLNKPNCFIIEYDDDEEEELSELANGVPTGCAACGGPYPYCKDSCNLWDN